LLPGAAMWGRLALLARKGRGASAIGARSAGPSTPVLVARFNGPRPDRPDHRAAAPTWVPTWTLRTACPRIVAPGSNRQVTVLGAIDATAWQCIRRLGRRCTADFIDLLD
jgi:hypothetical protein